MKHTGHRDQGGGMITKDGAQREHTALSSSARSLVIDGLAMLVRGSAGLIPVSMFFAKELACSILSFFSSKTLSAKRHYHKKQRLDKWIIQMDNNIGRIPSSSRRT